MNKTKVSIELPTKQLGVLDSFILKKEKETGLVISRNNMIKKIIKDFLMSEEYKG